jgi:hypothetical protein
MSALPPVRTYAQAPACGSRVKVTELGVWEQGYHQQNVYSVTTDLLVVKKSWFERDGRRTSHHERALTPGERRWLLAPFDPLYLSRLQMEYQGTSGPPDGFFYDVSLQKGSYWKQTRFIRYSFASMRTFSHRFNTLVPPNFRIFYEYQHP